MNSISAKAIRITNKILTILVFVFYPSMLIVLAAIIPATEWLSMSSIVFVPGVSFILVSLFRYFYNAPRPYEINTDVKPIIKKDSKGKSFPSRHIFSIFMIATTTFQLLPVEGIVIGLAGIVLAVCRVKGGVHFKKDVIAGAITGILLGIIGFSIWPVL